MASMMRISSLVISHNTRLGLKPAKSMGRKTDGEEEVQSQRQRSSQVRMGHV